MDINYLMKRNCTYAAMKSNKLNLMISKTLLRLLYFIFVKEHTQSSLSQMRVSN